MEESLLVSIAMCTFNGEKYLKEQLDTLICQTYANIEIVIVDDCSTDDTFSIIKSYSKQYPHFRIYQNEQNLGYTDNFERAIKLCNGEYIALCDQDDLWHPDKIKLQVEGIKDNMLIYHDSEFISSAGKGLGKKMSDIMNFYRGGQPLAFLFFNCVSGHTVLMKRALLADALPLKKDYFHDWWLSYVATNVGTIDFIPLCLVKYRQHGSNETDILMSKKNAVKSGNYIFQRFNRTLKWLNHCSALQSNKDRSLIENFHKAYKNRLNQFVCFDMMFLFLHYWHAIFFVRKKSTFSKLNYIRKQVFGFRFINF